MEETKKEQGTETAEEALLRFMAEKHPNDDIAMDKMLAFLNGTQTDDDALETLYCGVNYAQAVEQATHEGYIRGKNEQIELARKELHNVFPCDEGESCLDEPDLPLLRHMRRSVWDD